jgi:hypothetical protein
MDIPGHGVYLYSSPSVWAHISNRDAQALAINNNYSGSGLPGEVVADFKGLGLNTYNNGTWTSLHSADATKVDIDPQGDVVGEFPGQGVWLRYANGSWSQITTWNASLVCIASNAVVAAEFPNAGVWVYNKGWAQLTGANASSIDMDDGGNLVGEFPGIGVWIHDAGGSWKRLTRNDANQVAIGGGIVAASFPFPNQGMWVYNLTTNSWSHTTTALPSVIAVDAMREVVGEYGVSSGGIWIYQNGSWTHLTSASNVSLLDIGMTYYLG